MSTTPPTFPDPPRERWPLAVAVVALLAGVGLLGLALTGHLGRSAPSTVPAAALAPPAIVATAAPTPVASPAGEAPAAVQDAPAPKRVQQPVDLKRFLTNDRAHVPASWVAGFYDIYATAQRTYGVNWLLLAAVHKQETAFSTHPTTYHGLNFANCCAGPMQFNITNGVGGSGSTWARYKNAGRAARRPANYPNKTRTHPSIYDDYDAIMAAAKLLHDSGAGRRLDASAWRAAYDYYGHDLTGVDYANEVLARAIGWGQRSFCINCGTDASMLTAIDAAWGAPVRAAMAPPVEPGDGGPKALKASKD